MSKFDEWYDRYLEESERMPLEGRDLEAAWQAATLAERERCAKVARVTFPRDLFEQGSKIAQAIEKGE